MIRSVSKVRTGVIALLLCGSLFFGLVSAVSATTPVNNTALQAQIQMLMQLLVSLQAQLTALQAAQSTPTLYQYTNIDDGVNGVPTIVMTANPGINQTFSKTNVNDPIKVSWEAHNVPPHTKVQVEIGNIAPGMIGGGEWGNAIPVGDSRGVYNWDIHGIGRTSAGTYQVRVKLEECHPDGCNINAHFPGHEVPVKLYAVSSWRPIRVIGADDVVTSSTPTPIVTLTASAPSVASGNSVVLRWNATNAQRCVLQHSNEEDIVSLTGSKIIMPEEKETYLLWCANDSGDGKDGPSASAQVTVNVTGAEPIRRFERGPGTNAMACNRVRTGSGLAEGTLACYGLWDSGNEFGEDQNACGGIDFDYAKKKPTGCVVPAPVCTSGRALAASNYSISTSLSPSVLTRLASNFKTTESAVLSQLRTVWEYTCTTQPLSSLDSISIYAADSSLGYGIHSSAPRHLQNTSFVTRPSQLVVVGGYDAPDADGDRIGDKTVSLDTLDSNTLLVLSAYESVKWKLVGKDLAKVKAVYLTGYNDQFVTGLPAGVPVMTDVYQNGDDGFFIVYNGKGDEDDDFYTLRSYLYALTGQKMYSYSDANPSGDVKVVVR